MDPKVAATSGRKKTPGLTLPATGEFAAYVIVK
jgi:hypothetical protein